MTTIPLPFRASTSGGPVPSMSYSFTLNDLIACAQREHALRLRVYPRWVFARRMSQEDADRELACMQAIVVTLVRLREGADDGR